MLKKERVICMNANALRWDDFRIVLAIGSTNSLLGAARLTSLNHSTIFRRLTDIEERLEIRLFLKTKDGYFPTEAGEEVLYAATRMEEIILDSQRKLSGRDTSLEGSIRVTTTDTILHGILGSPLKKFLNFHPNIKLQIITTNNLLDLSNREADVAIRPLDYPSKNLVGRRVGSILQALYTSRENNHQINLLNFTNISCIGPNKEMSYSKFEKWYFDNNLDNLSKIKTNSILGHYSLLRSGHGYALLPCYLGDHDPDIIRASAPIDDLSSELWILTHPDLRATKKIQTFMEFMYAEISVLLP